MNESFGSCRPWAYDNARDNLNMLNNFKHNLHTYQKVYKKYSVKTKAQFSELKLLPVLKSRKTDRASKRALDILQNKTIQSNFHLPTTKVVFTNPAANLDATSPEPKLAKTAENHKRGQTSMEMINNQNRQLEVQNQIATQRLHYNLNAISKGNIQNHFRLINFDEQSKCQRLRKRDLHQIIFGQRNRIKQRPIAILR